MKGNDALDLRCEGLRPGRRYRLTRRDGPEEESLVFDGQPYDKLVAPPRAERREKDVGASELTGIEADFTAPLRTDEGAGQ